MKKISKIKLVAGLLVALAAFLSMSCGKAKAPESIVGKKFEITDNNIFLTTIEVFSDTVFKDCYDGNFYKYKYYPAKTREEASIVSGTAKFYITEKSDIIDMEQSDIDICKKQFDQALAVDAENKRLEEERQREADLKQAELKNHIGYKFSYSASSYLVENLSSGTVSYEASNLGETITVPWVPKNLHGKNGIGETVTLKGKWDAHLSLAIRNGYQINFAEDMYAKNARVKNLEISCAESGLSMVVQLADTKDTQVVDIREILPTEETSCVTIMLKVTAAYAGSKYSDLCIDSILPYFLKDSDNGEKVKTISDTYSDNKIKKNEGIDTTKNTNETNVPGNANNISENVEYTDVQNLGKMVASGSVNSRKEGERKIHSYYEGTERLYRAKVESVSSDGSEVQLVCDDIYPGLARAYFSKSSDKSKLMDINPDNYVTISFSGYLEYEAEELWETISYFTFKKCELK